MLPNERKILLSAQKGNVKAFEMIYEEYVPQIFRFIFLKTGNKEWAEDLTSETMIKFWRYLQTNEIRRDSASPILYRMARNLLTDAYRKQVVTAVELDDATLETIFCTQTTLLEKMMFKEEIKEVLNAVQRLKEEYREIIIMRFVEDLSNQEIAEITGKKVGTVRVLSHRALKSLITALEGKRKRKGLPDISRPAKQIKHKLEDSLSEAPRLSQSRIIN